MLENVISLYMVFTAPAGYSTTIVDPADIWTTQNIVAIKKSSLRVVVVIEGRKSNVNKSNHGLAPFYLVGLSSSISFTARIWQRAFGSSKTASMLDVIGIPH